MDSKHNQYCHEIPHTRRGCYCWEGDRQQLLEMRIGNMEKKMDNQTMKDYIEDLLQERAEMYERINRLEMQNTYLAAETARLERELGKHV
jgi:hypothetical protein